MGGGSEEEIAIMLDAHYRGLLDMADYWSVGDTREVSISSIQSTAVQLVILGMNHDDKADGSGKAAVTVGTKTKLSTERQMNPGSDKDSHSLWSTSAGRTWCNDTFFNAIPSGLRDLIKPVVKISNRYAESYYSSYRRQETTTDKVFLLSERELWGGQKVNNRYGYMNADGIQYEYMKSGSNQQAVGEHYLRTSCVQDTSAPANFIILIYGESYCGYAQATFKCGFSPAFCI